MATGNITYKGDTIFSCATGGVGWKFTPGFRVKQAYEIQASVGEGYWIKEGPTSAATHTLELTYKASAASVIALVYDLIDHRLGTLAVPNYGSFTNCRLSAVSSVETVMLANDDDLVLRLSLTFTQYP